MAGGTSRCWGAQRMLTRWHSAGMIVGAKNAERISLSLVLSNGENSHGHIARTAESKLPRPELSTKFRVYIAQVTPSRLQLYHRERTAPTLPESGMPWPPHGLLSPWGAVSATSWPTHLPPARWRAPGGVNDLGWHTIYYLNLRAPPSEFI